MGMDEIRVDEMGFVQATLPSNLNRPVPVVGFLAHVDTANFPSENIAPRIVRDYDGTDILLNEEKNVVLSPTEFENLLEYKGKTLITTDGTTLLGADDKAGVAEIMEAMAYLLSHPEIPHGKVRVSFGPDEEIGRGADNFNAAAFGADFAYTMDAGPLGELEYECFNAASAVYRIFGKSVHPGTAKGRMKNAASIAVELAALFPVREVPERTDGYEGFYHLEAMEGNCEEACLSYIIRDHDGEKFELRKAFVQEAADRINERYGAGTVEVLIAGQYRNMAEIIKDHMYTIDLAKGAMENLGIRPLVRPIRGGTDGSKISFMGIPTPNLFAGGENFHGRYEFVALESMEAAVRTIIEIIRLLGEGHFISGEN